MHRSGLVELDAVLAVARRGSFRGAAQALGMSTSAVSAAVAALEARLQVRLFNRTTRSVALTESGKRYVERIAPALAEIQSASDEIRSQPETPAGTLRLSAPAESARLLMPILVDYLQRHPQMQLELCAERRLIDIVAEGFDAGIRLSESLPQDMVAIPLGPALRMLVAATPAYLAAHGTPTSPEDLQHHACIGLRLSHGGLYRWELERDGEALQLSVPARLVVTEMEAARRATAAGLGLGFLAESHIRDELHQGQLVAVLEQWCPPFPGLCLYYPGHRHVPPALKALIEVIREHNER